MSGVVALRAVLASQFPDAMPVVCRTAGAVRTGIDALDALLPMGGLPRGRFSVWSPGGGATAVLRSLCAQAASCGERSAWIDGAGVATAECWRAGVLLLRPRGQVEALECAEELARSGGFAAVVLAGVGGGVKRSAVRLSRSARLGGTALIAVGESVPLAAMRVSSRLLPASFEWRCDPFGAPAEVRWAALEVAAETMGWSGHTRFRLPVLGQPARVAVEAALPDRKGVDSDWEPGRASVEVNVEVGLDIRAGSELPEAVRDVDRGADRGVDAGRPGSGTGTKVPAAA